ncbi:MAG: GAP family protein [Actinomycetia bacterium]|nr:GAP family protein [Actinomycetes bacterium]MCP5032444.1 GAP family protein [Actinomycetes bacterium]
MGATIGDILGNAVGVAISPVPIIAVILMLFTAKAAANSLSFLLGWVLGLTIAGAVVLALGLEGSDGGEAESGGWIKIVIGALFLFLGWRQWSGRPRDGDEAEMPGWMATIDQFNAIKSFGLAFLLAAVNPKNLGLTIAAVVKISGSGLSAAEEIGTLAVFILIASVTVVVPVVLNLALGSRAEGTLTIMKDWLVVNNNTVMTILFIVLGSKVLGDGISIVA